MDTSQIISFIETQLKEGKISKSDLQAIVNSDTEVEKTGISENSRNLTNTFYGIGATIAVIGVGILIGQHWNEIGFTGRLLVSLGIALVSYIVAILLRAPEQNKVAQVLFTISASLAPLGAYILLKEAGIFFESSTQIWVALCLFIIYGTALLVSKKRILVLITLAYATWAYYAFILNILDSGYGYGDTLKWATIIAGIGYILIAYWFDKYASLGEGSDLAEKGSIVNILNGLGTLGVLGAGIFLDDIFNLIYIAVLFAAFYGSVYLKSRAMLTLASLFLMAHIIKLTSKYFVDSIGWPVALIVVGFLVIGVGYFTFYLNRKYIAKKIV